MGLDGNLWAGVRLLPYELSYVEELNTKLAKLKDGLPIVTLRNIHLQGVVILVLSRIF